MEDTDRELLEKRLIRESDIYKLAFEEGVAHATRQLSAPREHEDLGLDISTIGLLKTAIQSLPNNLEIYEGLGSPLRGEIAPTWGTTKALFVFGKNNKPKYLGEPF